MTGESRIPRGPAAQPEHDTRAHPLSPIADKDGLRKTLLQRRRGLDPLMQAQWDERISATVLDWCAANATHTLGVLVPSSICPSSARLSPVSLAVASRERLR